jgi:hypothetical protein
MKIPEILLYIHDVICCGESIQLDRSVLPRLFQRSLVQTQYSFATQKKVSYIKSQEIFGAREAISRRSHLSPICGMYLVCNGKRWQTILHVPECPPVTPIFCGDRTNEIIRWEKL